MSDSRHRSPPSSFDVARLAGVSRSSVSRAFTPGASISEETRGKIFAAAAQLDYAPSAIARTLATRQSRIIAVVISELSNPFYAETLSCLSRALQDNGHTLLLFSTADPDGIDTLLPQLLAYHVDGVIAASAPLRSRVAEFCTQNGLPVVQFNRYTLPANAMAVHCDNMNGGALAADLLLDYGHHLIAFVAGDEGTSSSTDREKGFCDRLAKRGMALAARTAGGFTYEGGYAAARQLIEASPCPDAVFCANDLMALGLIDALRREYGLSVPEDISVIGFDNIPAARLGSYNLTTVDQNVPLMAEEAVALLVGNSMPHTESHRLIACRMIHRGSVAQRKA